VTDEKMYTIEEAAKRLGVHKMTLYTQIRKGLFRGAVNVEKDDSLRPKWRIPESSLHKGMMSQERRSASREKRQPEELLMPDVDRKREIIGLIRQKFPLHPDDVEGRYSKHRITIFGSDLAHGPDYAYLGASSSESLYVIEISSEGQVTDIQTRGKHPLHPASSEAAMLAWKREAIKWQDHYEKMAVKLLSLVDDDNPIWQQMQDDLVQIRSRRLRAKHVSDVIWEVTT